MTWTFFAQPNGDDIGGGEADIFWINSSEKGTAEEIACEEHLRIVVDHSDTTGHTGKLKNVPSIIISKINLKGEA